MLWEELDVMEYAVTMEELIVGDNYYCDDFDLDDEVETYTEDMFESEADWDDFNICSIVNDYVFRHMSIIEILDERNCDFTVRQWIDNFHTKHCLITMDADHNDNVHWYSKAFTNIAHIAGYVQAKRRDEFIFNECTVYIKY